MAVWAGWTMIEHSANKQLLTHPYGAIHYCLVFKRPQCWASPLAQGRRSVPFAERLTAPDPSVHCSAWNLQLPGHPPPATRRKTTNVCISWNRGMCIFPGNCTYRHVCTTCSLPHKAKDCHPTARSTDGPSHRQPVMLHPLLHPALVFDRYHFWKVTEGSS